MTNYAKRKIKFNVFRFNSETDHLPYYKEYEMEVSQDEVVLDILNRIKWEFDGSFSYRRSCRHGICGSCAIKVNGKPVLSCKENVFHLVEMFGEELTLDPQDEKRAIKDMVIDKKNFWNKYESIKPYLVAEVQEHPEHENIVSQKESNKIDDADYCIECGNCFYACPAVKANDDYIGPAALLKAFRFNADIRDKQAISNVATRHAVGFKSSIKKHGILDEGELVRYSEGNIGVLKHIPEAVSMWKKGKLIMPWKMPSSKNMDEIKKLVDIASTVDF